MWCSSAVTAQHNPDFIHSEIPFNLPHLSLSAILFSFIHSMCILLRWDDQSLFDQHDRIIPFWRRQEHSAVCGRWRYLVREQRCLPIGRSLRGHCDLSDAALHATQSGVQFLLPALSSRVWRSNVYLLFTPFSVNHPLLFPSIPGESLHVYLMFICMFCNCLGSIFYLQRFSPKLRKCYFHTRLMSYSLAGQFDSLSVSLNNMSLCFFTPHYGRLHYLCPVLSLTVTTATDVFCAHLPHRGGILVWWDAIVSTEQMRRSARFLSLMDTQSCLCSRSLAGGS